MSDIDMYTEHMNVQIPDFINKSNSTKRVSFSPEIAGRDTPNPRIIGHHLYIIGNRKVAYFCVEPGDELLSWNVPSIPEQNKSLGDAAMDDLVGSNGLETSGGNVWRRYSDFERLALFLHRNKKLFPRSLKAWYKLQSKVRPWRCNRSKYLTHKEKRLELFLTELVEDVRNFGEDRGRRVGSSSEASDDNSPSCRSRGSSVESNSSFTSSSSTGSSGSDISLEDTEAGSDKKTQHSTFINHDRCNFLDLGAEMFLDNDEDAMLVGQQFGSYERALLEFCGIAA
jgi:hypothetical protein